MKQDKENLKIILTECKDKLKDQLSSIDQISNKFNFLLGFNSLSLATLVAGLLSKDYVHILFKVSLILFLISLTLNLSGILIRTFRRDPNLKNLFLQYKDKKTEETVSDLIKCYINTSKANGIELIKLKKIFYWSFVCSISAFSLVIIYFIKGELLWFFSKILI